MMRISTVVALLAILPGGALDAQRFVPADTMPVCEDVHRGRFATVLPEGQAPTAADSAAWNPRVDRETAGVRVRNPESVALALARFHPRPLRRDSAEVLVFARVSEEGQVVSTQVAHVRGDPSFAPAANSVVRVMRFVPALYRGCRIPVLLPVPVRFSPPANRAAQP